MRSVIKIAEFYARDPAPGPLNVTVSVTEPYSRIIIESRSGKLVNKMELHTKAAEALVESLQEALVGRKSSYADLDWLFKDGAEVPWPESDSDEGSSED